MKLSSRNFFFYELHLLNLPFAFILKLFGSVYIYKFRGVCSFFLKNNFFESLDDYSSTDQWLQEKENTFKFLKEHCHEIMQEIEPIKIQNHSADFKKIALQHFFIQYEQYHFFIRLVRNYSGPNTIIETDFRSYLQKYNPRFLLESDEIAIIKLSVLDKVFNSIERIGNLLKIFYKLFLKPPVSTFVLKSYNILATGISTSEYPQKDIDLDFSWLVTNQILHSDSILYVLPTAPSTKTQMFLAQNKVNWTTHFDLLKYISFNSKICLCLALLKCGIQSIVSMGFTAGLMNISETSANLWVSVFKLIKPQFYLNSFSAGWPESPEVCLCKGLGIKSIVWFYSAGEFLYSKDNSNFSDLGIRYSINEAEQIWVWNNLVEKLFNSRKILPFSNSKIRVVGPILNGNLKNLSARKLASTPFTITVFDLTVANQRMRLNYGEGHYSDANLQEMFYQGIESLFNKFSNIRFIIKTKRNADPFIFENTPTLIKLQLLKSDRIEFAANNSDPYSLISRSDIVISMPLTSPSMLAVSIGKPALYYDPIGKCNFTFQNAFKNFVVKSEPELIDFVKNEMSQCTRAISPEFIDHFGHFTSENIIENIKNNLTF